ncbi:MAG: NfeD family protein [Verrucomicrobiae bacterium]|nr:NfeD family protein [Verrucomicrobiae bacterium]MCP5550535.1 NfeD family protein [Akkermansiaceae bacterium]
MLMQPWHWWLIAAIVLMIAEVLTSDFLLATFGLACLAACAVAGFGASFTAQLTAFVVAAALALGFVRPAAKRWLHRSTPESRTNAEGMVGRRATVVDPVGGEDAPGRVKIGGEEWRAVTEDGAAIDPGQTVEIAAVDSATLVVRRTA